MSPIQVGRKLCHWNSMIPPRTWEKQKKWQEFFLWVSSGWEERVSNSRVWLSDLLVLTLALSMESPPSFFMALIKPLLRYYWPLFSSDRLHKFIFLAPGTGNYRFRHFSSEWSLGEGWLCSMHCPEVLWSRHRIRSVGRVYVVPEIWKSGLPSRHWWLWLMVVGSVPTQMKVHLLQSWDQEQSTNKVLILLCCKFKAISQGHSETVFNDSYFAKSWPESNSN